MREEQIIAGKEYRLLADQYFLLATETIAGEQVGISMNAFNAECDRAGRQAAVEGGERAGNKTNGKQKITTPRPNFIC